ncbi:MAG: TIGR03862 family flavoprotein [Pseudomonadota bacterium]
MPHQQSALPPLVKPGAAVAIVGGGPAGLMAAETLSLHGLRVDVYDAMPSFGRKFLLAGKGGLNLTHSEARTTFHARYGAHQAELSRWLDRFDAEAICAWSKSLGIDTFVGSSGRIFPREMKAAPLLRAWLQRLRGAGVRFHVRHRLSGWTESLCQSAGAKNSTPSIDSTETSQATHRTQKTLRLQFDPPHELTQPDYAALVLALGGGSWARLGSDGRWMSWLANKGVALKPLIPANCGFETAWSAHLRSRFVGHPVKTVRAFFTDADGVQRTQKGELMLSENGIEGGLVYALAAPLRDTITAQGSVCLFLDLLPDHDAQRVFDAVAHPRGTRSLSSHLHSRLGLHGVKTCLLYECLPPEILANAQQLAHAIKALPLRLTAPRPLDEAISSAGGVQFGELNEHLMLRAQAGVFCAGEMLDWEAPTGGYLLSACLASGVVAGEGVLAWLAEQGRADVGDIKPLESHSNAT